MLSFINIMGGKNPLDDPEDEDESGCQEPVRLQVRRLLLRNYDPWPTIKAPIAV